MGDVPPLSPLQHGQAWTTPEGVKLLADAWDKFQQMIIDASRQAALLATILLGFEAQIVRSGMPSAKVGPSDVVCIAALVSSILLCSAFICSNAFRQRHDLIQITWGDDGPRPRTLLEGLQFIARKRRLAIVLAMSQLGALLIGIGSFGIRLLL